MSRDELVPVEGTVVKVCAGGIYRTRLDNGVEILARMGGRMRRYHIRVTLGDRITVGVSPYDPTHGLITYRAK